MSKRTIAVEIPPDAVVGDILQVTVPEGTTTTTLEVCIPEDSQPGDVLQLQLASATSEEEEEEDNNNNVDGGTSTSGGNSTAAIINIKMELADGTTEATCLEFVSTLPGSQESEDDTRESASIESNNNKNNDGTHVHVWSGAKYCAEQVFSRKEVLSQILFTDDAITTTTSTAEGKKPCRVLELGAGVGVMGLSLYAAALLRRQVSPHVHLVLSECNDTAASELLEYNIQHNQEKLIAPYSTSTTTAATESSTVHGTTQIECHTLDWTERNNQDLPDEEKFDLILGSDLLYNTVLLPALVQTIQEQLTQHGKIVWAVRWRKPHLERRFFEELTTAQPGGMEWTLLSSAAQDCHLQWNEFGNPQCPASNTYFCQRMVAVNGTLIPLADIGEDEMEAMSLDEYNAWEDSFVQVYLGCRRQHNDNTNSAVPTTTASSAAPSPNKRMKHETP